MNVLIGILLAGMVFSLGIPAIHTARESARRMQCGNNLKMFGVALWNYHDVSRAFPYGCVGNRELPPSQRWSWYLCIGNYMQHYGTPLIDLDKPWDAEELRPLMLHTWRNGTPPNSVSYTDMGGYYVYDTPLYPFQGLRCPSAPEKLHVDGQPYATYIGMAGIGPDAPSLNLGQSRAGVWAYDRQTNVLEVTDGSANTLLLIETGHQNGCWLAGGSPTVRGTNTVERLPLIAEESRAGQFGGYHANGSVAVFVDGRVDFLSNSIDANVFKAYCTASENAATSYSR
jgi:hypothetical protein